MTQDIQELSTIASPSPLTRFVARSFILVGGALSLAGCHLGTELEGAEQQHDVRYSEVCATPIFENNCSGIACHSPNTSNGTVVGGIDLVSPGLPERLYNQPASYRNVANPSSCPTPPELLANSSNPSASLVLTKIYGEGYACGDGMPLPISLLGLAPEQLECLTDYINAVILAGDAQ